jgi:hypothetical protein
MQDVIVARPVGVKPSHESVKALAHLIWLEDGQPLGCALDHWVTAESILTSSLDRYALEERCDRRTD